MKKRGGPMNQEEIDNLIGDDIEIVDETNEEKSEEIDEDILDAFGDVLEEAEDNDENEKANEDEAIVPPPADNKHKVVAQLDEVTKESEEKASQILDIMDEIYENVSKNIDSLKEIEEFLENHKKLCEKLHNKFPHIKTFEKELDEINKIYEKIKNIIETNEETQDKIYMAMDIMQYQDIHRQKIERVINIMRALIKYMNKLFEGSIEDEQRVKSAKHIHGDESETLSDEDIEALLDQFGA